MDKPAKTNIDIEVNTTYNLELASKCQLQFNLNCKYTRYVFFLEYGVISFLNQNSNCTNL